VRVVRRELKMPTHFPGINVERDKTVRIEVVARALVAVPIRAGIADAPIQEPEFGIVGTGHPRRAAAVLRAFATPSLVGDFVFGTRNGPETPDLRTGLGVVRIEKPADPRLAAGHAGDDLTVDRQRRAGHAIAQRVIDHFGRPALRPALEI